MARSDRLGWALAAVALMVTAFAGVALSTRHLELNLGPGDTPFVSGFLPDSEVEDKVGWHWTTYDALVDFPFETIGSNIDATLRYARVFGEEAVVDVRVGSAQTEEFRARGGEVRTTQLHAANVAGPLTVMLKADSHERRNMGLKMDRLRLDVSSGAPFKLRFTSALRPALTIALLFFGLLLLGTAPVVAGSLALVASATFTAVASTSLFNAWRQTQSVPVMLALSTLLLLALKVLMERRLSIERRTATWLVSAALVTMLFRLVLISHPDFYYPDLLTHTRVVDAIRNEGPAFFLHPAEALAEQKAWTKPVLGSSTSLPYAVMFHTPFALVAGVLSLNLDQIETMLKAGSCLISVLPILLTAVLATRLSLPPLAALALCVIPTYVSRLSFALMPALFGHVFDLVALLAITGLVAETRPGLTSTGRLTMFLFLGHIAYTSSVVNEGVFVSLLILVLLLSGRPGRATAGWILIAESLAATLAFALYYRYFIGDVFGLVPRVLGLAPLTSGPSQSVYPIESFWGLLAERTNTFFGWPYLGLALLAIGLRGRDILQSAVVRAWFAAFLVLILLRAKIPDVFRYGHETLFLTPLIAGLAGAGLILLWRKGGGARMVSLTVGILVAVSSFWQQWMAVSDQFGNAL